MKRVILIGILIMLCIVGVHAEYHILYQDGQNISSEVYTYVVDWAEEQNIPTANTMFSNMLESNVTYRYLIGSKTYDFRIENGTYNSKWINITINGGDGISVLSNQGNEYDGFNYVFSQVTTTSDVPPTSSARLTIKDQNDNVVVGKRFLPSLNIHVDQLELVNYDTISDNTYIVVMGPEAEYDIHMILGSKVSNLPEVNALYQQFDAKGWSWRQSIATTRIDDDLLEVIEEGKDYKVTAARIKEINLVDGQVQVRIADQIDQSLGEVEDLTLEFIVGGESQPLEVGTIEDDVRPFYLGTYDTCLDFEYVVRSQYEAVDARKEGRHVADCEEVVEEEVVAPEQPVEVEQAPEPVEQPEPLEEVVEEQVDQEVPEEESKGFFASIIDWFSGLFS